MSSSEQAGDKGLITSRAKHRIRLLRKLETSELRNRLWKLVGNPHYHFEVFCHLYFELCDKTLFDDPARGLELARFAPDFGGAAIDVGKLRKRELVVRGLAVLGGSYRSVGELKKADSVYRRALTAGGLRRSGSPISETEQANLFVRLSCLRSWQAKDAGAVRLAERAVDIYRKSDHPDLCRALSRRGVGRYYATYDNHIEFLEVRSQIIDDLGEALVLSANRDPRTHQSALHNLAVIALKSSAHADLKTAVLLIREAKRKLRRPRGGYWRCLPRLKLQWVESRFFTRAGATRHSERLLESARPGMRAVGAFESVLAGLDLAELYLADGRWQKLETLAREIQSDLRRHSENAEEQRAVSEWLRRIQSRELTLALLEEVQQKIESRTISTKCARAAAGKVLC